MSLMLLSLQLSFPSSVKSPSHEIQSFRNCSDMGPSHGLQFFKNCSSVGLFQESPMGRSSMLEQVFWQLLTGRCSSVGSSQTATFFRAYSPAVLLGPPWPAEGLVHHYHLLRLQRNLCSNAWSTSSLCFFTDLDFWIVYFFTVFSLLSPTAFAPLFLHSYQNLAT